MPNYDNKNKKTVDLDDLPDELFKAGVSEYF